MSGEIYGKAEIPMVYEGSIWVDRDHIGEINGVILGEIGELGGGILSGSG